jgi:tight adherence protein B
MEYIIFIVALFIAVALAVEGGYQLWASKNSVEARRIASRLRDINGMNAVTAQVSIERRNTKNLYDGFVSSLPSGDSLLKYVQTSGTGRGVIEMLLYTAALGAIGAVIPAVLNKPWVFSVLGGGVLAMLPWFWLSFKRNALLKMFERQIPEALDLMGRALRAGHAFPTGVKMVADEMPNPIAREFRTLYDETNFGMPQNEALMRLADRVPIDDLRYFVIAVMIQRESGGNLAELLDSISSIVRNRLKLLGEIRTLSAEGKLSAWILGLLPFCVGLMINIVNPKFMDVLWTDPMGLKMVGGALVMMVLGVLWMRSIIKIRV